MMYRIKAIVPDKDLYVGTEDGKPPILTERGREAWCYGSKEHRSSDLNEIYRMKTNWIDSVAGAWYYVVEEYSQ
jgi:hypothetical protein